MPGNLGVWDSKSSGSQCVLFLQNDGNLVIYAADNRPVWATNTVEQWSTVTGSYNAAIGDFIHDWLHHGECENKTGRDITIGVDGKPQNLPAGQKSPPADDCDGIVHPDGSATKIWGSSGVAEHKGADWVRDNWPDCARAHGQGSVYG